MSLTEQDNELLDELASFTEEKVEETEVTEFTDPKGGLHHSHPPDKHRVEEIIGQRIDDVESRLDNNPNSHEGVHELYFRADEFDLTDSQRSELRRLRVNNQAPIPAEVEVELERKYGG
jgi:hypothetical protein